MTHATILAIGSELTQGQVTNRNAAWISERLTDLGVEVLFHLVTPDERDVIADALDIGVARSDLLIITGGLGPTSDDFTRDVLADWSGQPLEYSEAAWEKIVRRLSERGIEVAESNRQQCYFPKDSIRLENSEGTADGFRFLHRNEDETETQVVVLPGPPTEGKHLWDQALGDWLQKTFPLEISHRLERWHCLGKSESALGEIVEAVTTGLNVKTGYRASMPYIEVKTWIPETLSKNDERELIVKLDTVLGPYCVSRNDETLLGNFMGALHTQTRELGLTFLDLGTGGRLSERLFGALRSGENAALRSRSEVLTRISRSPEETASGFPASANEWLFAFLPSGEAVVIGPKGKKTRVLPNPYPNPALSDRLAGYRAEMALKVWCELLAEFSE